MNGWMLPWVQIIGSGVPLKASPLLFKGRICQGHSIPKLHEMCFIRHISLCAPLRGVGRKNVLAQTCWPPLALHGWRGGSFLPPGKPCSPGHSPPASASGGFIFLPQPAKGVLVPHPGGMREYKELALYHGIPWQNKKMVVCCNCSFTKHVFACLSIMQANNTDQRNQNYSSTTALMLMTLGCKLKAGFHWKAWSLPCIRSQCAPEGSTGMSVGSWPPKELQ